MGLADSRAWTLLLWLYERVIRRERVVLFENSHRFPVQLLTDILGGHYTIIHGILKPELLGFPIRRPRLVACCFLKAEMAWCGPDAPAAAFNEMLMACGKDLAVDADAFLWQSDEGYTAYLQKVLRAKGEYCDDPLSLGVKSFLPPSGRIIFDKYALLFEQVKQEGF
eukprot:1687525-Alexandrium_andersonii.AAC.1